MSVEPSSPGANRPGVAQLVPDRADLADLLPAVQRIRTAVQTVIEGKPEAIDTALTVLLAGGHLLIEDVPGVGKTQLAKTLARALDCTMRRIQFTPDLLPGDVTGVSIFNQDTHDFEFRPGAIFANLVLGDEINRASPKTQAALLECMEERQVTVDGTTYELAAPFMVIATQNPVEMEGTYPLPEAQRDRFMAQVSMGYPSPQAEMLMLAEHASSDPLDDLTPVADSAQVIKLIDLVHTVYVAPAIHQYAVDLAGATRRHPDLRLGASPRATLHLIRAAKAAAALDDRDHVLPDDLKRLLPAVFCHRLLLSTDAQIGGRSAEAIVADVVRTIAVPATARG